MSPTTAISSSQRKDRSPPSTPGSTAAASTTDRIADNASGKPKRPMSSALPKIAPASSSLLRLLRPCLVGGAPSRRRVPPSPRAFRSSKPATRHSDHGRTQHRDRPDGSISLPRQQRGRWTGTVENSRFCTSTSSIDLVYRFVAQPSSLPTTEMKLTHSPGAPPRFWVMANFLPAWVTLEI